MKAACAALGVIFLQEIGVQAPNPVEDVHAEEQAKTKEQEQLKKEEQERLKKEQDQARLKEEKRVNEQKAKLEKDNESHESSSDETILDVASKADLLEAEDEVAPLVQRFEEQLDSDPKLFQNMLEGVSNPTPQEVDVDRLLQEEQSGVELTVDEQEEVVQVKVKLKEDEQAVLVQEKIKDDLGEAEKNGDESSRQTKMEQEQKQEKLKNGGKVMKEFKKEGKLKETVMGLLAVVAVVGVIVGMSFGIKESMKTGGDCFDNGASNGNCTLGSDIHDECGNYIDKDAFSALSEDVQGYLKKNNYRGAPCSPRFKDFDQWKPNQYLGCPLYGSKNMATSKQVYYELSDPTDPTKSELLIFYQSSDKNVVYDCHGNKFITSDVLPDYHDYSGMQDDTSAPHSGRSAFLTPSSRGVSLYMNLGNKVIARQPKPCQIDRMKATPMDKAKSASKQMPTISVGASNDLVQCYQPMGTYRLWTMMLLGGQLSQCVGHPCAQYTLGHVGDPYAAPQFFSNSLMNEESTILGTAQSPNYPSAGLTDQLLFDFISVPIQQDRAKIEAKGFLCNLAKDAMSPDTSDTTMPITWSGQDLNPQQVEKDASNGLYVEYKAAEDTDHDCSKVGWYRYFEKRVQSGHQEDQIRAKYFNPNNVADGYNPYKHS